MTTSHSSQTKKELSFASTYKNIALFIVISIVVNACLRLDIKIFNEILETSFTESLQSLLLIFIAVNFYLISKHQNYHHGAILITSFFIVMFIRESDYYLDTIYHGFWALPSVLVTVAACVYYYHGKGKQSLLSILNHPHMTKVVAGVILLIVFSRSFGTGSFWQDVMQEHYIRNVKNIAQEGIELLCYFLIAVGAYDTKKSLVN